MGTELIENYTLEPKRGATAGQVRAMLTQLNSPSIHQLTVKLPPKSTTDIWKLIGKAAQSSHIQSLNVSSCRLDFTSFKTFIDSLGNASNLYRLDLSNNQIGDFEAKCLVAKLAFWPNLCEINLDRTKVTQRQQADIQKIAHNNFVALMQTVGEMSTKFHLPPELTDKIISYLGIKTVIANDAPTPNRKR